MLEKLLPFIKEVIAQAGTKFLIAALAIYLIAETVKIPELDIIKLIIAIIGIVLVALGFYVFRFYTDKFKLDKGDKS